MIHCTDLTFTVYSTSNIVYDRWLQA